MLQREMEGWVKDATAVGVLNGVYLVFCFEWLVFFNFLNLILIFRGFSWFGVVVFLVFNKTLHGQHTGVREAPVPQCVGWRWQVSLPKGSPHAVTPPSNALSAGGR